MVKGEGINWRPRQGKGRIRNETMDDVVEQKYGMFSRSGVLHYPCYEYCFLDDRS